MMGSPARAGEFRRCARVLVGCVHIGRWEVRLGRVETFETFYTPPNLACWAAGERRSIGHRERRIALGAISSNAGCAALFTV